MEKGNALEVVQQKPKINGLMSSTGIIGFILIVLNIAFTYKGLKSISFYERYKFEVQRILVDKDYKRIITSGFLHVSWIHLFFNMFALYAFSGLIEGNLGGARFLIIYFTGLIGGELLSLFIHRNHGDYSSVGASGAVSAIIFATIALFPGVGIGFIFITIPNWLYGILFIGFSVYGIRSNKQNIGHEAHLGGAIIGMIVALLMQPAAFANNYPTILIIAIPAVVLTYIIITRPAILMIDNLYFKRQGNYYSVDHKYNEAKATSQEEIDRILDKINSKGINSLNSKEKEALKKHSKELR